MKRKFVPRLSPAVVKKLQGNTGGGRHRDKKKDFKRNQKHRKLDSGESNLAIFIKFLSVEIYLRTCLDNPFKLKEN